MLVRYFTCVQLIKISFTLFATSSVVNPSSTDNIMKQFYPAADRNKDPILQVLKKHIISSTESHKCLEVASGSGQHVSFFASHFPNIHFYPSEESRFLFDSIDAHVKSNQLGNVEAAQYIDAASLPEAWYDGKLDQQSMDYVYNCNMIHLVPMSTTESLFRGSSYYLKPSGLLITYGPYADNGTLTPDSNVRFNESIQSLNPAHGIRDITLDLIPAAKQYNLVLINKYDMPANNKVLVWQKQNAS